MVSGGDGGFGLDPGVSCLAKPVVASAGCSVLPGIVVLSIYAVFLEAAGEWGAGGGGRGESR